MVIVARYKPLLILAVVVLLLLVFHEHIWRSYIAPREAVTQVINRCEVEANKIFALEIAKWIDANKTDAFNPYRKERDKFIETCVKADGRCSLGDGTIWPSSRPWEFAPIDLLGKWLYDVRYLNNEHVECHG
jgi:hypothetical protein